MTEKSARELLADVQRMEAFETGPLVARLAVLATFDPALLEDQVSAGDLVRPLCTQLNRDDDRAEWMLSDDSRIRALVATIERSGFEHLAVLRAHATTHFDTALQRMLDVALRAEDIPVDQRDDDELVASLRVWHWLTEAVASAGKNVQFQLRPDKDTIEAQLAIRETTRAVRVLANEGCVGRDRELAALRAYRASRPQGTLADDPPMVVHGIGGIGKSTIMATFMMEVYRESELGSGAWAYLDFDRPTLSSYEPSTVIQDIIRQFGAQFAHRQRLLLSGNVTKREQVRGYGHEAPTSAADYSAVQELAAQVQELASGRLTVVLDTFEEVQRADPDKISSLRSLFTDLSTLIPDFKLVVCGRGAAKGFIDESRPDRAMLIDQFDPPDALNLLRFLVSKAASKSEVPHPQVTDELLREIVDTVGGSPLTLKLAAQVLIDQGTATAFTTVAERAEKTLSRIRDEFIRGFLQHRIIDHIASAHPDLSLLGSVARAGIVVRYVTQEIIGQVLLPSVGAPVTTQAIGDLFAALGSEAALGERRGSELHLRDDLRSPALLALTLDDGDFVRQVHTRAADFFATQHGERARVEYLYHRLALGDLVADLISVGLDQVALRALESSLADLPEASAADIRSALDNSATLTQAGEQLKWERRVASQAEVALAGNDLDRARTLLAERDTRSAGTQLHAIESRIAEVRGDLAAAADAARRDMAAAEAVGSAERFAVATLRVASLEERQRYPAQAAKVLCDAGERGWLRSFTEIRLELHLNRMNVLERNSITDGPSRWSLDLDGRILLRRLGATSVPSSTALVRLLAAAYGRAEPEWLRTAVSIVGLGFDPPAERIESLAAAIADWVTDSSPPGMAALAQQIPPFEPGQFQQAALVAGLLSGSTSLPQEVLIGVLSADPPEPVREAIRAIYLWWGIPGAQTAAVDADTHFLDEQPIDFRRPEAQQLERVLAAAYPTSTEIAVLMVKSGVSPANIASSSRPQTMIHSLLVNASETGQLDKVLESFVTDPSNESFVGNVRTIVGEDWFDTRGLSLGP
jgi:hypothetical protein